MSRSDTLSTLQPHLADCIETLLQYTEISRFVTNVNFDIDEDPLYPDFVEIDGLPETLEILGYVRAMLPTKKAFSESIKRFTKCRRGKQQCSINVNMSAEIFCDDYELLDMSFTSEIPTLEGYANADVNGNGTVVDRSRIPEPEDTQDRIKYIISYDDILKLATRLTYAP